MQPDQNERTWAFAAHALGPVGLLCSAMMLGFLGPLVILLAKGRESAFVAEQAREALNFQITIFLLVVGMFLAVVFTFGLAIVIAIPLGIALWIFELVFGLRGALSAYEGKPYRYPLSMRFIT